MTSECPQTGPIGSYRTRDGAEREVVAVQVDGLWTVIDVRRAGATEDGDRDERVVETRLGGVDEVAAVVADYVEQALRAGCPQVRAA